MIDRTAKAIHMSYMLFGFVSVFTSSYFTPSIDANSTGLSCGNFPSNTASCLAHQRAGPLNITIDIVQQRTRGTKADNSTKWSNQTSNSTLSDAVRNASNVSNSSDAVRNASNVSYSSNATRGGSDAVRNASNVSNSSNATRGGSDGPADNSTCPACNASNCASNSTCNCSCAVTDNVGAPCRCTCSFENTGSAFHWQFEAEKVSSAAIMLLEAYSCLSCLKWCVTMFLKVWGYIRPVSKKGTEVQEAANIVRYFTLVLLRDKGAAISDKSVSQACAGLRNARGLPKSLVDYFSHPETADMKASFKRVLSKAETRSQLRGVCLLEEFVKRHVGASATVEWTETRENQFDEIKVSFSVGSETKSVSLVLYYFCFCNYYALQ